MPYKDSEVQKAYWRDYRAANRERIAARKHDYYTTHLEAFKSYVATHRQAISSRRRVRDAAHPEKTTAYNRAYYETHRETINGRRRAYHAAHPEIINARKRTWKANHLSMVHAYDNRRRARKRAALCTATADQVIAITSAYKGRCAYCGKKSDKMEIDHVIPLSKGGTHTPENLVPACKPCNSGKRDHEAPCLPAVRLLL